MSLRKALKLDLDDEDSCKLDRLMGQRLGYAARIAVDVQPDDDSLTDCGLVGGGITITLAATTLTHIQALRMCGVLDTCSVQRRGPTARFAEGTLQWESRGWDYWDTEDMQHQFPDRPKGQALRAGAILMHSTYSCVLFFSTPVEADEEPECGKLLGYYESSDNGKDALDGEWHEEGHCPENECYQCGGGSAPSAHFEDASLKTAEDDYSSAEDEEMLCPSGDTETDSSEDAPSSSDEEMPRKRTCFRNRV